MSAAIEDPNVAAALQAAMVVVEAYGQLAREELLATAPMLRDAVVELGITLEQLGLVADAEAAPSPGPMLWLPPGVRDEVLAPARRCAGCGCTDERACPGGCTWEGPDRCSACGERAHAWWNGMRAGDRAEKFNAAVEATGRSLGLWELYCRELLLQRGGIG